MNGEHTAACISCKSGFKYHTSLRSLECYQIAPPPQQSPDMTVTVFT